jgi:copper resistance protein B
MWWPVCVMTSSLGHLKTSPLSVQGLAPMKFEVSATAYLGEGGQTAANVEAEYELLLTNRLILQPLVEVTAYGKNDPLRGIGSGLSTAEAGYDFAMSSPESSLPTSASCTSARLAAPRTSDAPHGESQDTRMVIGLRIWF